MSEVPTASRPEASGASTRNRRPLLIVLGLGIVLLLAVGASVTAWLLLGTSTVSTAPVRYTSESEHYSVAAPGDPVQEEGVAAGIVPTTTTHWGDGDLYYAVSSSDFSSGTLSPMMRGAYLHDVLVGALSGAPGVSAADLQSDEVTNAFLIEPEQIDFGGGQAYQFGLTLDGARFQVVVAGHEPMIFMVVCSDSADRRDEDFLDSFTFLE